MTGRPDSQRIGILKQFIARAFGLSAMLAPLNISPEISEANSTGEL